MSDPIIRIENISKKYRIGLQSAPYGSLRESISNASRNIIKSFRLNRNDPTSRKSKYDHIWALKNVSVNVNQGEVLGIIGRNGAGKSTLLKIISRITKPTEGRVRLKGRVGSLLEVGTGFHPELTGRENVFLNGAILGMKRREIERKFDEIVSFAEIDKFLDTPVKFYSSGMYMRLAFSVAAHLDPEVLLIDEVLAVGDLAFQKKCLGKMGSVVEQGRTILFISHNLAAIQKLCNRCIMLDSGEIYDSGDTKEVINNYIKINQKLIKGIEIKNLSRESNLGEIARITKCDIVNGLGVSTNSLMFGEPVTIELECILNKKVENASFLVGFDSMYEQRLLTITSLEVGKYFSGNPGDIKKGMLNIDKMLFKPGVYNLTLAILVGNDRIDRIPDAAQIEIVELPFDKDFQNVKEVTIGMIQIPNPKWGIF